MFFLEDINKLAVKYDIQLIYAFGSRADEFVKFLKKEILEFSDSKSDLDLGIKCKRKLSVDEKIAITYTLENIFKISKVDLILINEAPVSLAYEIVTGELIYSTDLDFEAEYQLYIMRQASELHYFQKQREKEILGF